MLIVILYILSHVQIVDPGRSRRQAEDEDPGQLWSTEVPCVNTVVRQSVRPVTWHAPVVTWLHKQRRQRFPVNELARRSEKTHG